MNKIRKIITKKTSLWVCLGICFSLLLSAIYEIFWFDNAKEFNIVELQNLVLIIIFWFAAIIALIIVIKGEQEIEYLNEIVTSTSQQIIYLNEITRLQDDNIRKHEEVVKLSIELESLKK